MIEEVAKEPEVIEEKIQQQEVVPVLAEKPVSEKKPKKDKEVKKEKEVKKDKPKSESSGNLSFFLSTGILNNSSKFRTAFNLLVVEISVWDILNFSYILLNFFTKKINEPIFKRIYFF